MTSSILSSPLELWASTTRRVSPREPPSKDLTLTCSPEPGGQSSPALSPAPSPAPPCGAPPTEDR